MMKPSRFFPSFSFFFLLLVLSSYSLIANAQEDTKSKVRIGYLPIYVELPLFVAKENGFFDKRGVQVELERFASSPDLGKAFDAGDVQVGASIAYSVALQTEIKNPDKFKAFIVDSETPENYLSSIVVLKTSNIKSVQDLRGKKLASFPGPTAVTFLKLVLEKFGLNPERDVDIKELEIGSHIAALQKGEVDALFTYEPTGTQAVMQANAVKILPGAVESNVINPWQAGIWIINNKFASENPDRTRKIILALYDAIDYIRLHPEQSKSALLKFTNISEDVANATPNIPFAKIDEVNFDAFQKHADILSQRGVISQKVEARKIIAPKEWVY